MPKDDRYTNFSEIDGLIDSFRPGNGLSEEQNVLAGEIQDALRHHNPMVSIQHLLAFQTATVAFQNREILKSLRIIKGLLFVTTAVVVYGVYHLVS